MKGSRSAGSRRFGAKGLIALVVVAGLLCAQASHLFHTHDLRKGTATCIVCSHEQTLSLASVGALSVNPVAVEIRPAEPRNVDPVAILVPLQVAPKTSPPLFC